MVFSSNVDVLDRTGAFIFALSGSKTLALTLALFARNASAKSRSGDGAVTEAARESRGSERAVVTCWECGVSSAGGGDGWGAYRGGFRSR